MKRFAKWQPKDGDLILVCSHRDAKSYHWFVLDLNDKGEPSPMQFRRPDGSEGEAIWGCICEDCKIRYEDPQRCITGERLWTGDEPAILDMAN